MTQAVTPCQWLRIYLSLLFGSVFDLGTHRLCLTKASRCLRTLKTILRFYQLQLTILKQLVIPFPAEVFSGTGSLTRNREPFRLTAYFR